MKTICIVISGLFYLMSAAESKANENESTVLAQSTGRLADITVLRQTGETPVIKLQIKNRSNGTLPVYDMWKAPDCCIKLLDADEREAEYTQQGRVYVSGGIPFGSWRSGVYRFLKPGQSISWEIDLGEMFKLRKQVYRMMLKLNLDFESSDQGQENVVQSSVLNVDTLNIPLPKDLR